MSHNRRAFAFAFTLLLDDPGIRRIISSLSPLLQPPTLHSNENQPIKSNLDRSVVQQRLLLKAPPPVESTRCYIVATCSSSIAKRHIAATRTIEENVDPDRYIESSAAASHYHHPPVVDLVGRSVVRLSPGAIRDH